MTLNLKASTFKKYFKNKTENREMKKEKKKRKSIRKELGELGVDLLWLSLPEVGL